MALRVRCCNRSDAVGSRVSQLRYVGTHHEASKIGSIALRSSLREWPPLENLVLLGRQDMNTEGGKSHRSTYSFPDVAGPSSMPGWMLVIRIVPTAARRLKAGCSEIALDSSKGGEKLIITTPHSVLPTPPSSLGKSQIFLQNPNRESLSQVHRTTFYPSGGYLSSLCTYSYSSELLGELYMYAL